MVFQTSQTWVSEKKLAMGATVVMLTTKGEDGCPEVMYKFGCMLYYSFFWVCYNMILQLCKKNYYFTQVKHLFLSWQEPANWVDKSKFVYTYLASSLVSLLVATPDVVKWMLVCHICQESNLWVHEILH